MNNDAVHCKDYINLLQRSIRLFGNNLFIETSSEKLGFNDFFQNICSISSDRKGDTLTMDELIDVLKNDFDIDEDNIKPDNKLNEDLYKMIKEVAL